MAAVQNTLVTAAGTLKKVWANLNDVLPEGYVGLMNCFPFETGKKPGSSIEVPMVLTAENGVTFGDGTEVNFADAQAGAVKSASVSPYETFVSSGILTSLLCQAATEGEQAVKQASKLIMKNNIKSHFRFLENALWYGQDTYGLGRVAYNTSTFRGVSFTAGAGTIGGVTFSTGGIYAAGKKFLIHPDDWATGIWIGSEGMEVEQIVTSGGAVADTGAATGKVVSVDLDNAIVEVDFTPIAATSTTSHYLRLKASTGSNQMVGVKKILTNTGTLFGLSAATYSLLRGTQVAAGAKKLTWDWIAKVIGFASNKGLDTAITVVCNFEGWSNLLLTQTALRSYDSSYDPRTLENGADAVKFNYNGIKVTVRPSRFIRRSDCFFIPEGQGHRYGTNDVGVKIPGMGEDGSMVVPPITSNKFIIRTHQNSQIFLDVPCQAGYLSGIDPESAS